MSVAVCLTSLLCLEHKPEITKYDPFLYIYGPYVDKEELQPLYKKYESDTPLKTQLILREVDRIKLLISIMSADLTQVWISIK